MKIATFQQIPPYVEAFKRIHLFLFDCIDNALV